MRLRCSPPSPEQAQDEGWGWESEDGNEHADADPTSGSAQPRARANAKANNARPRRQLLQCCHAKCTSPATIAIPAGTVYEYTAPLVIDRSGQFPEVSGGEQWQGGVWAQDAVRASHTPFWQQGDPSDTPAWQRRIRCSRCTGCGSMVTGQCLHCGAGPEMSANTTNDKSVPPAGIRRRRIRMVQTNVNYPIRPIQRQLCLGMGQGQKQAHMALVPVCRRHDIHTPGARATHRDACDQAGDTQADSRQQ